MFYRSELIFPDSSQIIGIILHYFRKVTDSDGQMKNI